jgi:hypothetical protein
MKSLLILLILANAGDATLTIRNMTTPHRGFYEVNPLLRPVFTSPARVGVYFGAASIVEWAAARKWHRHHPRAVDAGLTGELAAEGWGIGTSLRGHSPAIR